MDRVEKFGVGQPVLRTEDPRLLTGGGNYFDDVVLPGQTRAYILRSPHAHARIDAIDTTAASAAPGVIEVLTAEDYEADGYGIPECLPKRKRRDWRTVQAQWTQVADDPEHRLALAFGNEVTGLTTEEADLLQELVHVRTAKEHTSLNLAVTVGVALASLFTGRRVHQHEPGGKMLNGEGREFLKSRLKEVFAARVARTPSAAKDITEAIERVFSRAPLENRDARAWHLMLKALGSEMSPTELGLTPNPTKDGRRLDALERARKKGSGEDA